MVSSLLLASVLSISPAQTPASGPIDASALKIGAPATVAELDLGKLKGDLRQIAWKPDGAEIYIQTADGDPASPKLHHYSVAATGGAIRGLDVPPDWATAFWTFKSDRSAPGIASLQIDVAQKMENVKVGTGSGRPDAAGSGSGDSVQKSAESQHQSVVQLTLVGQVVSEFVNERPIPGLMFSWGPQGSGAIAYTTREDGRLMLLDAKGRTQAVAGVKDATLPAWSMDGTRLAWAQKTGRKKYNLVSANVTR
jgi:hypothetical protein